MNKKKLFFLFVILSSPMIYSVGQFKSALKKPSLADLRGKIEEEKQKQQSSIQPQSVKKIRKNPSFLTRTIDYLSHKKEFVVKKMRRFYRSHFYLSLFGVGLLSLIGVYCLNVYCMPLLHDCIQKYRKNASPVITPPEVWVPETVKTDVTPLVNTPQTTVQQPEQLDAATQQVALKDANTSVDPQVEIKEPVKETQVLQGQTNEIKQDVKPDSSVNEPKPSDQKVEVPAPATVSGEVIGLPFKKIRSSQEINESKKLYNRSFDTINGPINSQVDDLTRLKNDYEAAKKRVQESPQNIKYYNDCLKKEKAFTQCKNNLIHEVKKVEKAVDSSSCFKDVGPAKELSEDLLKRSQTAMAMRLKTEEDSFLVTPRAILSDARKDNVVSAVAEEKLYGNEIVRATNLKYTEYFLRNTFNAQKTQYEEFSHLSGILKRVLLPFIESL
jgi:hypothetical protein